MNLEFREPVRCADAEFGELADVVIDPQSGRVTHLVVQPHHRHDEARLVAFDRVRADGAAGISLDYTVDALQALERVQQVEFIAPGEARPEDDTADVGIENVVVPSAYEGYGYDGTGLGVPALAYDPRITLSYDRIPHGMVEIRRDSSVVSSGGDRLGHVAAVVIDGDARIEHLVLEHRHLFSKKDVAIPLSAVAQLRTDEVTLALSAEQVAELEPLP
jgi:sporulation protein YlmC with PRC-barrel domain